MVQFVYLLTLAFSSEALAQDAQKASAERVQIRRKLQRLSKRNAWAAVDESYRRLLSLGVQGDV